MGHTSGVLSYSLNQLKDVVERLIAEGFVATKRKKRQLRRIDGETWREFDKAEWQTGISRPLLFLACLRRQLLDDGTSVNNHV